MNNNENLSAKTEPAKKRLAAALAEYAANWGSLQGSIEKEDLNAFLTVWKEEFDKGAKNSREKLFQLANLLSNLDIQLDMLRSRKDWKKPEEENGRERNGRKNWLLSKPFWTLFKLIDKKPFEARACRKR